MQCFPWKEHKINLDSLHFRTKKLLFVQNWMRHINQWESRIPPVENPTVISASGLHFTIPFPNFHLLLLSWWNQIFKKLFWYSLATLRTRTPQPRTQEQIFWQVLRYFPFNKCRLSSWISTTTTTTTWFIILPRRFITTHRQTNSCCCCNRVSQPEDCSRIGEWRDENAGRGQNRNLDWKLGRR